MLTTISPGKAALLYAGVVIVSGLGYGMTFLQICIAVPIFALFGAILSLLLFYNHDNC